MIFRLLSIISLICFTLLFSAVSASDYIVQPGDEISIVLPGESSLSEPFTVDRDGNIMLPELGAFSVKGLEESELRRKLSKVLKTVFIELRMLRVYVKERQILITVSGYVENPGEVTLPANSTIQMAVHAAGGLRSGAQLDKMVLADTFDFTDIDDSLLDTATSLASGLINIPAPT